MDETIPTAEPLAAAGEAPAPPPVWLGSKYTPPPPPPLSHYFSLVETQDPEIQWVKTSDLDHLADNPLSLERQANPFSLKRPSPSDTAQNSYGKAWGEFIQAVFQTEQPDYSRTPLWFFFVLVAQSLVFAAFLRTYYRQIPLFFKALFYESAIKQLSREFGNNQSLGQKFVFQLAYLSHFGSLLFLLQAYLSSNPMDFQDLALSFGFLAGLSLWTQFKHQTLTTVFPIRQEIKLYQHLLTNSHKVLVLVSLPLSICLAYFPDALVALMTPLSLGFLAVFYAQRSFRALITLQDVIYLHKFHFLLYLCSVELAPLLVLAKSLDLI